LGVSVTAEVTVTSPDLGTRALFQGVVLSDPRTGAVVAGARNAPTSALQWIGEEGVTRTGRAWTSRGACGPDALRPGEYRAHAVAATLDEDGATPLVLSDPWTVEVVEEERGGRGRPAPLPRGRRFARTVVPFGSTDGTAPGRRLVLTSRQIPHRPEGARDTRRASSTPTPTRRRCWRPHRSCLSAM